MSPGVRITAGELKGARLSVPAGVRPTSQMAREALFSRWQGRLEGASFLDLFAGSGAVGLEAASRGATRVVCVEASGSVLRALEAACRDLVGETARVCRARLPGQAGRIPSDGPFDLVFADPPYAFDRFADLLAVVAQQLAPTGEAAVEHACRVELPEDVAGLARVAMRRYGDSCLSYYSSPPRE